MNQIANLSPAVRDRVESITSYRNRANMLAEIQMVLGSMYLYCSGLVINETFTLLKASIARLNKGDYSLDNITNNDILFLEHLLKLDAQMFRIMAWIAVYLLRAFLHFVSSFLLTKSAEHDTAKKRAVMFCKWAKMMNWAFFVADVAMLIFGMDGWQAAAIMISYRLIFNFNVKTCMKAMETLAPPPPGRH